MKRVFTKNNKTKDIVDKDISRQKKQNFVKYIESSRPDTNSVEKESTFNESLDFGESSRISGFDPNNTNVIQRYKKNIVCIDSSFRDQNMYPNVSSFKSFLGNSFKNVVKIKLVSSQIPNVEEVIKNTPSNLQNNIVAWQNEDEYSGGTKLSNTFIYNPTSRKILITVPGHGLTETTDLYYFNCSIKNSIDFEGLNQTEVVDKDTLSITFDSFSNYTGTIDIDFGVKIHKVEITPGSYNSIRLAEELQSKMNLVKRDSGAFHYFQVNVDNKTDIFYFKSFTTYQVNSGVSTTNGSNLVTITLPDHPFKENEEILVSGITNTAGLSSTVLNGLQIVVAITKDTIQYQVSSGFASITINNSGGNNVLLGKYSPFRFLFDTENTLIQNVIGFPNEDSSEYIGAADPLETRYLEISRISNNTPVGYTTFVTTEDHLLSPIKKIDIDTVTINSNPIYIVTKTPHGITSETTVRLVNVDAGNASTSTINLSTINVLPLNKTKLQVTTQDLAPLTFDTTDYTLAYLHTFENYVNIDNLVSSSNSNSELSSGKNVRVIDVFDSKTFSVLGYYDYIDYNLLSNARIGVRSIKVTHPNHLFNQGNQFYTEGGIPTFSGTSTDFFTGITKLALQDSAVPNDNFNATYKTDCIILENDPVLLTGSTTRSITSITIPQTGVVQFTLSTDYFYQPGESIVVAGTTALDGTWEIFNVISSGLLSPPFTQYTTKYIQIKTGITTLTFSGATLAPNFHLADTLRIIYPEHALSNKDYIKFLYSSALQGLVLDQEYLVLKVSDNSLLVTHAHSTLFTDSELSALIGPQTSISNVNNELVSTQTIGQVNYYNKYQINNVTGQIKLGQNVPTRIQTSSLPDTLEWTDIKTDTSGKIHVIGRSYYKSVYYDTFPVPAYYVFNYQVLSKYYVSSDGGTTYQNKTEYNISNATTGAVITVIGNTNIPNTTYSITKLTDYSFTITVPHSTVLSNLPINYKLNQIGINGIIVENDPTLANMSRDVISIQDVTGPDLPANVKFITVDTGYTYITGESITLSGTNSLDGTYTIYATDSLSSGYGEETTGVYIISSTLDNSITGTATVSLPFAQNGTLKIISPSFDTKAPYKVNISSDSKYVYLTAYALYGINGEYPIFRSVDSQDFTEINVPNIVFTYLTVSKNGQYIVCSGVESSFTNKYLIYISNDFGVTFNLLKTITLGSSALGLNCVAMSENARYITVVVSQTAPIKSFVYSSNDFGVTWNLVSSIDDYSLQIRNDVMFYHDSIDMSDSGQYQSISLVDAPPGNQYSHFFCSDDYGQTFVIKHSTTQVDSVYDDVSIDSSGKYQIISGMDVYYSEDYGNTWNSYNDGDSSLWGLTPITNTDWLNTLFLDNNGRFFYTIKNKLDNVLYKWEITDADPITIQVQPSSHFFITGDLVEILNNSDDFLNGVYNVVATNSADTFDIIPNKLIVPTTYTFKGTVRNLSRIVQVNDSSVTTLGEEFFLLENSSGSVPQLLIESVSLHSTGVLKVKLQSSYYFAPFEEIVVNGTAAIDGVYQILLDNYKFKTDTSVVYISIDSSITDFSFNYGVSSISPNYYLQDTVRIISNNYLGSYQGTFYLVNVDTSPLTTATNYKVVKYLGTNSFLTKYTHAPDSIGLEDNITGQLNTRISDLVRKSEIKFYRIESKSGSNEIGGITLDVLNNTNFGNIKLIDSNTYLITTQFPSTNSGNYGGADVVVSSLNHGVKSSQYNTRDGTSATKLFRKISLEGYNYIYLCTYGKETELDIINTNNNGISNIFAKILLDEPIGYMCFDSFISTEKIFYTPIPELSELQFDIYTPDGYLYNFNDTNYSLDLEITTIYEELELSNVPTKNNTKIKYNLLDSSKIEESSAPKSKVKK